jgi:hypothetical protein
MTVEATGYERRIFEIKRAVVFAQQTNPRYCHTIPPHPPRLRNESEFPSLYQATGRFRTVVGLRERSCAQCQRMTLPGSSGFPSSWPTNLRERWLASPIDASVVH